MQSAGARGIAWGRIFASAARVHKPAHFASHGVLCAGLGRARTHLQKPARRASGFAYSPMQRWQCAARFLAPAHLGASARLKFSSKAGCHARSNRAAHSSSGHVHFASGSFHFQAWLVMFFQIPPHAVICHYAQVQGGAFAVVSVSGKVLASSFFELRERFQFHSSISGAGCWVVLVPVGPSSFSQATQQALF